MDIGITKMSTKGQIVIPSDLRADFAVGEKLVVIKSENKLIIKKATELDEQLRDDLEFSKRTEEAWKEIEQGKYTKLNINNLDEMDKW